MTLNCDAMTMDTNSISTSPSDRAPTVAIEQKLRPVLSRVMASELQGAIQPRDKPKVNTASHSYAQDLCSACSRVPNNQRLRGILANEGNRVFNTPRQLLPQQMNQISTRGWTFNELLRKGRRFKPVPRISCCSGDLDKRLQKYEDEDIPLVVEGWQDTPCWPNDIFNLDYCRQYFHEENQKITVRNMHTRVDKLMRFDVFLEKSRNMTTFTGPEETERWYGKDVECPQKWEEWLRKGGVLPGRLIPEGSCDHFAFRLKQHGRSDIETLMCYFGVADTYTPCHKDLCASSGQNLMCYTEGGGSSFWFMTKGSDSIKVTEYFHTLQQELDHENYTISVERLAEAPFDVYVVEQKLGDLVLVPPRSCHQVINFGGMSIKMSWSRMTLAGLSTALYHELPLYRRVCRPEVYQIKSTICHTLFHYTHQLKARIPQINQKRRPLSSATQSRSTLVKQLCATLPLYDRILLEEFCPSFDSAVSKAVGIRSQRATASLQKRASRLMEDFYTCDFCGADIFQSFFQCVHGADNPGGEGDGFVLCPGCYVEGRTCVCEEMKPMQRDDFTFLFDVRWKALDVLRRCGISVEAFGGSESLEEQKSYFSRQEDCNVFRAAMLLYHTRQQRRQDRKLCGTMGNHTVPSIWTLNCKKCHRAKCFPHLLKLNRMHSIRGLLLQEQDGTHNAFHQSHKEGHPVYEEGRKHLLEAHGSGTQPPDFNLQMVYNSLKFGVCEPINPTHWTLGWYDLPASSRSSAEQPKLRFFGRLDATSTRVDDPQDGSLTTIGRPLLSPLSSSQMTKNRAYVEVLPRKRPKVKTGLGRNVSTRVSVPLSLCDNRGDSGSGGASKPQLTSAISTRRTIVPKVPCQNEPKNRNETPAFDSFSLFDDDSELTPTSSDSESPGPSILAPRNRGASLKRHKLMDLGTDTGSESHLAKPYFRNSRVRGEESTEGASESVSGRIKQITAPSASHSLKRPAPVQDKGGDRPTTVTILEPLRKRLRREKAPGLKSRPADSPSEVPEATNFSASLSSALNGAYHSRQNGRSDQTDRPVQESTTTTRVDSQTIEEPSSISTLLQPEPESASSVTTEPKLSRETPLLTSTPSLCPNPVIPVTPDGSINTIPESSAGLNTKDDTSTGELMHFLGSAELETVIVKTTERVVEQLTGKSSHSSSLPAADIIGSMMVAYATAGSLWNNNRTSSPAVYPFSPHHDAGKCQVDSFSGARPPLEGLTSQGQPFQPRPPPKSFRLKQRPSYQHRGGRIGTLEHRPRRNSMDQCCADLVARRQWTPHEATPPRNHTPKRSNDSDIPYSPRPEWSPGGRPIPQRSWQRFNAREEYWTRPRDKGPTRHYGDRPITAHCQRLDQTNADFRTQQPHFSRIPRDHPSTQIRVDATSPFYHRTERPDISSSPRRSSSPRSRNRKGYFTHPWNRAQAQGSFREGTPDYPSHMRRREEPSFGRPERHAHSGDSHMSYRSRYLPREDSRNHGRVSQQNGDSQSRTTRTGPLEVTARVPPHASVEGSPGSPSVQPEDKQERIHCQSIEPPLREEGLRPETHTAHRNLARAQAKQSEAGSPESSRPHVSPSWIGAQDRRNSGTASWTREIHTSSQSISQHPLPSSNPNIQKNTYPLPATSHTFESQQQTISNRLEEAAQREPQGREYDDHRAVTPPTHLLHAGNRSDSTIGSSQLQDHQSRNSRSSDEPEEASVSNPRSVYEEGFSAGRPTIVEPSKPTEEDQYWEDEYVGTLEEPLG